VQNRNTSRKAGEPPALRRNIRISIAFDGTAYHGWQIQRAHPTVQGRIVEAIRKITREDVILIGSGRTDSGAHARRLVANFRTCTRIATEDLVRALNGVLPRDIRILEAKQAPDSFHAQHSARSKVYRYHIYRGAIMPPHLLREYFHFPYSIDMEAMSAAARGFLGKRDFASFAARMTPASEEAPDRTIRVIYRSELQELGHRLLYTVEGSGFLHHMVRNMVGTMLEIGRRRISLAEFQELFSRRDRTLAGFTAPAHGLVLLRVRY
jgi:tRNA pseudouridine38-40 synthase